MTDMRGGGGQKLTVVLKTAKRGYRKFKDGALKEGGAIKK